MLDFDLCRDLDRIFKVKYFSCYHINTRKQSTVLSARPQMWPSILTLTITLTSNFQGQIFELIMCYMWGKIVHQSTFQIETSFKFWNKKGTYFIAWSGSVVWGYVWNLPDSKVHGANMGPTWVLSAPDGPHEPCYQGYLCLFNSASVIKAGILGYVQIDIGTPISVDWMHSGFKFMHSVTQTFL